MHGVCGDIAKVCWRQPVMHAAFCHLAALVCATEHGYAVASTLGLQAIQLHHSLATPLSLLVSYEGAGLVVNEHGSMCLVVL